MTGVVEVLQRVARLADKIPEVAELDINPLIARSDGAGGVDVKIRLAPPVPEPDPYARRLR